ncbi:hypothetical protein L1887_49656 [Cichorium endivia]|nr:hypothetical protein L1887_49656 [Cichorium endivia]
MNLNYIFQQDAASSSPESASAPLPAPTLPQLDLEEPARNSVGDMHILSAQARVSNWLADVHLSPPTSSPILIDDIDIDHLSSIAVTPLSHQSLDTMAKRSRQRSGSPAPSPVDPDVARSPATPPVVEDEGARKKRRILEHIAAQTAVDPSDQLRTDQLTCVPRSYQLELAQIAKSGNVLVCLDTGSGKTLISVLLLQHIHSQPVPPSIPATKRKVSFFLVNLVPLVHQQSSVIAGNSDLAVGKLYGELKEATRGRNKLTVDNWHAPQWAALLQSHQVIVATAQCFLDALIHGFIKMSDLNLIIFDEVHHALKNHPFFRIMKYYRLAPANQRPKIFGMTASPIFTRSGMFHEAAHYLQSIMDARIHTVSKAALDDLDKVKQKPDELVVEFAPFVTVLDDELGGVPLSDLSREMLAMFAVDVALEDDQLDPVQRHFRDEVQPKLEHTMRHLGAVGCDEFWHSTLLELRSRARKWAAISRDKRTLVSDAWIVDASMRSPRENGDGDDGAEEPQKSPLPLGAAHLSNSSELNRRILLHMRAQPALPDELRIDASNASPKLLRLVELLQCFEPDAANFCAIVFVERRQTATLLVELIKRAPGLGFIHPEFLLGHDNGSAAGGAPAMDWHDQVQVLNRFRRRAPTNLLVATSIAEEGLDIQAANLVIRFDLFNRHISFLQSRGRARARGSRFILMAESGNADHAKVILNAFDTEARRSKWLDAITESGGDGGDADAMLCDEWQQRLHIEPQDPDAEPAIHEPTTGARLYAEDAPSLVAHYAATLHSEHLKDAVLAYRMQCTDVLGGTPAFSCTLELPSTAAVRSVDSGPCSSKKRAKRMAALRACQQLRQLGELDEWLMPKLVGATVADRDAAPVAMNPHHKEWRGTGQPIHLPVKKMDGWARFYSQSAKEEAQWHATFLPMGSFDAGYQPLLLLTRGALPATERLTLYHAASGEMKPIRAASLGAVPLGSTELEAATQFTRFVFALLSRREVGPDDGEPAVLVAPVRVADGVSDVTAWSQLAFDWPATLESSRIDLSELGSLQNRVLTRQHGYASNALYIFQDVRHDLTAISPLPPKAGTETVDETQTYLSQHLTKYARRVSAEEAATLATQLASTPLVAVTKLGKLTNLLTAPSRGSRAAATPVRFIIPRFYRVFPLRSDVLLSVLALPSILARYDQLLLASQCNDTLLSGSLEVDLVLEALASPAARCGLDYERLEFLGDTFLKLVATCHTFTTQLGRTEAELHLANKGILTNVRLLREARRLQLGRWALFASADFGAKRCTAPMSGWMGGALLQAGPVEVGPGETDVIREKTLPDVVEALIGAALLGGGTDAALHVCRVLTLIPESIRRLDDFNTLLQELKLTSVTQGWERRVDRSGLDHLQSLFGHVYRYPHLGLEAFTHPSLLASVLPSYQRLEFLGDAWLDLYIVRYIFSAHPDLSPGELTALKGMLASNSTLAALGHRLGLHRYVASNSEVLVSTLSAYSTAMEGAGEGTAYWHKVDVGVPKALADVVEASFASIVVDLSTPAWHRAYSTASLYPSTTGSAPGIASRLPMSNGCCSAPIASSPSLAPSPTAMRWTWMYCWRS